MHFYAALRGRLGDRLHDLQLCRQRLRAMQETLEVPDLAEEVDPATLDLSPSPTPLVSAESFWESIRDTTTARVVLPGGLEDLERAAGQFLETLTPDQWTQLDQAFQDQVLAERDGLFKACLAGHDLNRYLTPVLLTQAVAVLGNYLPITDVAEVELLLGTLDEADLPARIQTYHEHATPQVAAVKVAASRHRLAPEPPRTPDNEQSFLLIPASESGKRFGEEADKTLEGLQLVNVSGQADLMFCRELDYLRREDLERILQSCRGAYEESVTLPNTSPHARFDIQDWTPLDP
jgi:hypothetical protein